MSNKPFHYQAPFPLKKDDTEYYLLTSEHVSVSEFEGQEILKVAPEALTLLARQAFQISANCSVPFLSQYTWHSSTVTNSSQGAGNGDFSVFKPEKHLLLQY